MQMICLLRLHCLLMALLLVDMAVGQSTAMNAKNVLFVEYSLEGADYSINYERIIINAKKVFYTLHAGIFISGDRKAIPLGLDINTGHGNHHADFTITLIPLVQKHYYIGSNQADNDKFLYIFPGAGYRYQKPKGGFFLRALAGPMIILDPQENDFWNMNPSVKFNVSVGAGISFGR